MSLAMPNACTEPAPHADFYDEYADDAVHDECGVFGVFAPGEDVARYTYFALQALQHRGQESAGMAVGDGTTVMCVKNLGLVTQVFEETDLNTLKGDLAIGHTRYPCKGEEPNWSSAQPHLSHIGRQLVALAHNGNLVEIDELRARLTEQDIELESHSNSQALATIISAFTQKHNHIRNGMAETMSLIEGAYAVVLMTEEALYAFRDPHGIRPLAIGKLSDNEGLVVASETAAFDIVGAEYLRDVEPGEIIKISRAGLESMQGAEPKRDALCVFEFVYIARPDSVFYGRSIHEVRHRMGEILAAEAPVKADLIMSAPASGTPAAIGYAAGSGVLYGEGLTKNNYVGRTFIEPSQALRRLGVRLKLNPIRSNIAGKRVVLVDDSIVRGTTMKEIVKMLRDAGAAEVHVRISSPPVLWPCFYGVDTDTREQLIAASLSVKEIDEFIGADSLAYISIDGMVEATGRKRDQLCCACFDGDYPVHVSDEVKNSKKGRETWKN
ncbi:MAG: amidophosphoribosyltransferase [Coriobacteriia bacterium]|nr:amidophosphoribosyltransferase [Coriobacteriia bacterium]